MIRCVSKTFSLANHKMIVTNMGQYIAQVFDWRDDRLSSDKEKNRRCKPQLVSKPSTGLNEMQLRSNRTRNK